MWEKCGHSLKPRCKWWITPTCVGKSNFPDRSQYSRQVHSHVCGKKRTVFRKRKIADGTLPRVWEKVHFYMIQCSCHRYTPTCVGKSGHTHIMSSSYRVHSHVCGKKSRTFYVTRQSVGTLPRVWEKESFSSIFTSVSRYTPTCVGKRNYRCRTIYHL